MNNEIDPKADPKQVLKDLGIFFKDTSLLQEAYDAYRVLPMLPLTSTMQLLVLDLNNLPVKPIPFKEVFLRWMLQVNETRIMNGEEPIMTFNLAKMCPIWKIIKMPVRSVTMSRDGLTVKLPKLKSAREQTQPRGINRKK